MLTPEYFALRLNLIMWDAVFNLQKSIADANIVQRTAIVERRIMQSRIDCMNKWHESIVNTDGE